MCMDFIKGMGAGLIVGACLSMTFMPEKKSSKKAMGKAVRALESVMSDVSEILGL